MPYSGTPSGGVLDAIRFWLQDTADPPLLNDQELQYFINYAVGYTADPILLAAGLCTVVMSKYAGEVNVAGDGITVNVEALQDKYRQLQRDLRDTWTELNGNRGLPYAGGMSFFDWVNRWNDKPPLFAIGQHDNPRGSSQLLDNRPIPALEDGSDYYGTPSYFEGG